MAIVNCVVLKFCVFYLIFIKTSQSIQINSVQYEDSIESGNNLVQLSIVRSKRDVKSPDVNASMKSTIPNPTESSTLTSTVHLLGVNGTGQRKLYNVSTDVQNASIASVPTNSDKQILTKGLGAVQNKPAEPDGSDFIDKLIDSIDEDEQEFNKTQHEHLLNVTEKKEYFEYYNSSTIVNKTKSNDYWSEKKDFIISNILSKSHRRAITVQLKFDFPFYGHIVRNVTVATGGFLYTGEYVHSWLAATQYIAPLMANFDTSISNISTVKYCDNGTAFTVVWDKVPLQDANVWKNEPYFTFGVTLYNTGDIIFAYKTIPIDILSIKDEKHPVKIGLSDAYIIDKNIYWTRRKTIYEYHRVNFAGIDIKNDTLIKLKALPTCLAHNDCVSCLNAKIDSFNCTWCPAMNRCSSGTDRKRQEWLQNKCDKISLKDAATCSSIANNGNYSMQTTALTPNGERWISTNAETNKTITPKINPSLKNNEFHTENQSKNSGASFALGILLPIIISASLIMWLFYAYRNPHTKSGQFLIQYRPSQWSWRRGEARYTAATIHM